MSVVTGVIVELPGLLIEIVISLPVNLTYYVRLAFWGVYCG